MNPRNLTREDIEELNDIEPYCFETDREEQWFNVGLQYGLDVADSDPKSHWISVNDDLPCNHEELIATDGPYEKNTICVITINKHGIIESNHMVLYDNGKWEWRYDVPAPCYWMLIPKLPKESEIDLTVY